MENYIIITIIVLIFLIALRPALKHMKGQGSCCSGGASVSPTMKKEIETVVALKVLTIEGMN